MSRNKGNASHRKVGIEISSRDLTMVIVEKRKKQPPRVRGHRLTWAQGAASLGNPDGMRQLTKCLAKLVAREQLAKTPVQIALTSDFCVTRVVAGRADAVHDELYHLRERTNHYLWLGAGAKAQAESSRAIDAKHVQTWLTVANEGMLIDLAAAVKQAGLKVSLIEHSVVAVCRALGNVLGEDADPVLIIELNQRGIDLGVCHRGSLLFDYRPGGIDSKERVAEIVARHLERIRRYCSRQFRFAEGQISRVYLYGEPQEVARVGAQFSTSDELSAQVLDLRTVCPDWEYDDDFSADSRYVAPLGCALSSDEHLQKPAEERGLPNLMDHLRRVWRAPLLPSLARLAWPVAATLLLAAGVFGASLYEHRQASAVEIEAAAMEPDRAQVSNLKLKTGESAARANHLRSIQSQVHNAPWHDLVSTIGHCLPRGTWLESVRIDDTGMVAVTGSASSEDLVFDLLRYLKKVPVLKNVNLEAQRPSRSALGPVVNFDIQCEYLGVSD